ncbi:MAG: hypothetical protein IPL33_00160 [Sphingobacteriales bacterium]|nr:hypothetical protein [Sphingobacteriales bacterium]
MWRAIPSDPLAALDADAAKQATTNGGADGTAHRQGRIKYRPNAWVTIRNTFGSESAALDV